MVLTALSIDFPVRLSEEMIASYERSGFLVTSNVLSRGEIKRFGAVVDAEVNVRTQKDKRSIAEKSLYD